MSAEEQTPPPRHPLQILVVDDNKTHAELFAMMLRGMGHYSRAALGAAEALASIEVSIPDVLIADLWMPEVDGYGLASAIRAIPRYESVLLVAHTALDESSRVQAMEAGFQYYLSKPVEVRKLQELLKTLGARRYPGN